MPERNLPIRLIVPRVQPPLDLDAPIYRYFIDAAGGITVLRDRVGARVCREKSRRPAPRSAARS